MHFTVRCVSFVNRLELSWYPQIHRHGHTHTGTHTCFYENRHMWTQNTRWMIAFNANCYCGTYFIQFHATVCVDIPYHTFWISLSLNIFFIFVLQEPWRWKIHLFKKKKNTRKIINFYHMFNLWNQSPSEPIVSACDRGNPLRHVKTQQTQVSHQVCHDLPKVTTSNAWYH